MAKQKQYNKGQLGKAHAFRQTFFETKGHPCRKKQERPHSVKLRLAFNEKRMFDGIANSLSCTSTMALRIALVEYHRFYQKKGVLHDDPNHIGRHFGQNPVNGYGRRKTFFTLTMSDAEADILNNLCIDANAEMAEMIRIIGHEFSRMITDGTLTRLQGSKKETASDSANRWLKAARASDKPKTGVMQAAQEASEASKEKLLEAAGEAYKERGDYMEYLRSEGLLYTFMDDNGKVDAAAVDYHQAREAEAADNELYNTEGEDLQSKHDFIRQRISWGATPLEAQQEWTEELENRKEMEEMQRLEGEHGELYFEWSTISFYHNCTLEEFLENPDHYRDLHESLGLGSLSM
jgi:hypothetical protein